jgi:hypothetical protein
MDHESVLLPVELPRLSDEAAAQFIELLHALLTSFENHHYAQIARHHQREREALNDRQAQLFETSDPPF